MEIAIPTPNQLLYDFSLTIGDTVVLPGYFPVDTLTWYVIEHSTMLVNAGPRRYLGVETNYFGLIHQDIWIEGIGSVHGLLAPVLAPPYSFEWAFELVCFTDLGSGFQYKSPYRDDTAYNCQSEVGIDENLNAPAMISCYPNPSDGQYTIENNGEVNFRLSIYSVRGEVVYIKNLKPYQALKVDASNWSKGIYILSIEGQGMLREKLVLR